MSDLAACAALSTDYEWLCRDGVLAGAHVDLPGALPSAHPNARVLDCACATGAVALTLSACGFTVSASDPRATMVAHARSRLHAADLSTPVVACEWGALEHAFAEPFDAVVCAGNAIVRAEGPDAMVRALRGMRRVVRRGGRLVLTSRNWEALRAWRPRVVLPGQWHDAEPSRLLALYVWTISNQWTQRHTLDVVVVDDRPDRVTHRHHRIEYLPFRVKDLVQALRAAAFASIDVDYTRSLEWYTVTARAV